MIKMVGSDKLIRCLLMIYTYMVLAPCNKVIKRNCALGMQNFKKWIAKLPGFAIINAWQHFGNRKSASHNK